MAQCIECGEVLGQWRPASGRCLDCENAIADGADPQVAAAARAREAEARALAAAARAAVILTTETHVGPVERLGIVASEAVLGMHVLKDIATAFRDTFGGRSDVIQTTLRDARALAFDDIRDQAVKLGAGAVIAISVDYRSIQTAQGSNLFLVAVTGTAVTGIAPVPARW